MINKSNDNMLSKCTYLARMGYPECIYFVSAKSFPKIKVNFDKKSVYVTFIYQLEVIFNDYEDDRT